MERYKDITGGSGVAAYEIGPDYINVQFKERPDVYGYTYARPGAAHVERMKALARRGHGLATYISKHVRERYAWRRPISNPRK
jgi:hypothetical protein